MIVYDDCSSVPPEPYIPKEMKVTVIRGDANRGQGHARNRMLEVARSEYVHFHDADDLLHRDWCREIKFRIKKDNPDLVFTQAYRYDSSGPTDNPPSQLMRLMISRDLVGFVLRGYAPPIISTFRAEWARRAGGYAVRQDYPVTEDMEFHLRLALLEPVYSCVPKYLAFQRWRPGSSCRDARNQIIPECHYYVVKCVMQHFTKIQSRHRYQIKLRLKWSFQQLISSQNWGLYRRSLALLGPSGLDPSCFMPKIEVILVKAFGAIGHDLHVAYRKFVPSKIAALVSRRTSWRELG